MSSGRARLRLVLLLLPLLACEADPPVVSPLEGLWLGEDPGGSGGWTLNVEGERFFIQGPDSELWYRGVFELEPDGEPGSIDLLVEECDCAERGKLALARYRLSARRDGAAELSFASRQPGVGERPVDLKPAEGVVLLHFRAAS